MGIRDRYRRATDDRPELGPVGGFLYSVSAVSMMGVTFISPVFPVMVSDLGITESEVALMITLYTLPAVAFVPISGWLADRIRRDAVLTASLLIFGVAGTAIFFTEDITVILALRFVQGIGASGIMPMTGTLIGDLFEGEAEVGAQGMRVVTINAAKFVYPVAGGVLGAIAWNLPFLFFAVAVPAGIFVASRVPEPSAQEATGGTARGATYRRMVLASIRHPSVGVSYAVVFLRFFVKYGVYTFLPLMAVQYGIGPSGSGLVLSMMSLGLAVMASQARWLAARAPLEVIVSGGMVIIGVVAIGFSLATSLIAFLLVGFLYGVAEGFAAGLETSLLTQNTPIEVRAGIVSFGAVVRNVAKTVSPITFGVAAGTIGLETGFFVSGAIGALGGAVILLLVLRRVDLGRRTEVAG